MTSAYAFYDISYAQRTPYLTLNEVLNYPSALDYTNLISGNSAAQQSVLTETIGRASSWIDEYTCGAWGTLCATQNSENARVWGNRNSQLTIHPKYWPIISVDSFSYSSLGYGLPTSSASINPSANIWVEPQEFVVTPTGIVNWGTTKPTGITTMEYFCQWTYTNGWVNTTLAASVAAGAASITPTSTTGILPGTLLTFYDVPTDESVQVTTAYVPGTTPVPLTAPLAYNHTATVSVTNLPPIIKQAALLLVGVLLKQRGSGSLILSDMGPTTSVDRGDVQTKDADLTRVMMMLDPYRMRYVGY